MRIETERLILRPWRESDAPVLYRYCSDEKIAKGGGWPPHASEDESRFVIRSILSKPETYAICLKDDGEIIGSIGLRMGDDSPLGLFDHDGDIGYWIGVPFWGNGYATEALAAMVDRAFASLHAQNLWCCYISGNKKSRRVMDKCGFAFHHTDKNCYLWPIDKVVTEHFTILCRDKWQRKKRASLKKSQDNR